MNILLTSAGRRTYMAEYFKNALRSLHMEGTVYASNSVMSPALAAADAYFITPLIYDDGYIPFLLEKCRRHSINMIVPLFDVDLPVLAAHKDEFSSIGVKVAVSDPDTIGTCRDKYRLFLKLWKSGIRCPETELNIDDALLKISAFGLSWPVVVKPRFGMGSIGLFHAYDKNELKAAYSMCRRKVVSTYINYESRAVPSECVLIQEMRKGGEYGLDIISDFDGNYLTTIVRRKLAMRAGETDEAVILGECDREYKTLSELGALIAACLRPEGLIDADVIMEPENMAPYVIDINARFGGGYPFSHIAGADVPKAYILLAEGKKTQALDYICAAPGACGYKDIVLKKR